MLNRIRIGEETAADIDQLKERVRKRNHQDIKKASGSLFIFGTNMKVNQMNNRSLKDLKGEEQVIMEICLHKSINKFKPSVNNAGNISNTPFQKELRLKTGAKVMLTYNIDTSDGLTNGARGELIGFTEDAKGIISKLIVRFENERYGTEKRRRHPGLLKKYPG